MFSEKGLSKKDLWKKFSRRKWLIRKDFQRKFYRENVGSILGKSHVVSQGHEEHVGWARQGPGKGPGQCPDIS